MNDRDNAQQVANLCLGFPMDFTATQREINAAKRHGKRVEGRDGDHFCIGYFWKGRLYITEASLPPTAGAEHE